jgi:hypothetical protein
MDNYLGWAQEPFIYSETPVKGYGLIRRTTGKYGFRVFGDPGTKKTKILVLGDSYTEAGNVSDGYTYYETIAKLNPNVEIFSYGEGGYGSVQEYLVLDRYFDEIKPDIIIWQFHYNDLVNNSYELEIRSFKNNNLNWRPYLRDGKIEYLFPYHKKGFLAWLSRYSYVVKNVNMKLDYQKFRELGTIENKITKGDRLFDEAVKTTKDVMALVRKRAGNIPVVAFLGGRWLENWPEDTYANICRDFGMFYIPNMQKVMYDAKGKGIQVDGASFDGHWGMNGHLIAGRLLHDFMVKRRLIPPPASP